MRGLIKAKAAKKQAFFNDHFLLALKWIDLKREDWLLAAKLWSLTTSAGKQLDDTDLLVAALTQRLNGIIVSADDDFDALPIKRENWRQ